MRFQNYHSISEFDLWIRRLLFALNAILFLYSYLLHSCQHFLNKNPAANLYQLLKRVKFQASSIEMDFTEI